MTVEVEVAHEAVDEAVVHQEVVGRREGDVVELEPREAQGP